MRPPGFEPGRRGWKPLMLPLHHGRVALPTNLSVLTASMRGLMLEDRRTQIHERPQLGGCSIVVLIFASKYPSLEYIIFSP
jgi:hypothetical protein